MSDENQHWVPKFLIKNFVDKDGRVFCLDVHTDKVSKLPPKKAASRSGFNEFLINGEAVSFEDRLEKIETRAAPVLKRIISSRSVAWLDQNQRSRIAQFIAAQSFRTEAFYKGMELGTSREQFGSAFSELWRSSFLVSNEVERRQWAVMTIQHDDIFYLGDNPVVLQHAENPSSRAPLGFDIEGVEVFLPLTPKCALYMPCLSISKQVISGYETAVSMHRKVRSTTLMGRRLPRTHPDPLELSPRIIRKAHDLYQALTAGAELPAAPENVENLNYLQCSWAYGAIYANRGDFTFATRVLRETPQYRKIPRTSFALVMPAAS